MRDSLLLSDAANSSLPQSQLSFCNCDTVLPRLPKTESQREAALKILTNPVQLECVRLFSLSLREWRDLLRWLDISGLALSFYDQVCEMQLAHHLPAQVRDRLRQNLADNTRRTQSMIAESISIQREFQQARLRYANLKGFALAPRSVSRPELRSQFDLDFLVSKQDVRAARGILEHHGYRLYDASSRSLEFKRNEKPGFSLKDLYKDLQSWRVELHIESTTSGFPSVLDRLEWREMNGFRMPVLSEVDSFLGQGLHAYKHVCSEFFRASHLLEFRRHVLSHHTDDAFWNRLREIAGHHQRARLGIGVVTLLITHVMGDFAPKALLDWTVHGLPPSAIFWVRAYGRRAVLASFPGSKFYLLLQSTLEEAGMPVKRSVRQSLLPGRLPPPIIRRIPDESLSIRLARYRMQLGYILTRFRFHLVEGVRYAWELQKWRRLRTQTSR